MAIGRVGVRPYGWSASTTTTTSGLDTDAQAFILAAVLTDTTQINAVNDLVVDLKAAGVWTKMKALYPMVGGTADSHKWNLKDPRNLNEAFRLVFYGGVTHNSSGVLGNGTNAWADTFLNMSTEYSDPNNVHLSTYVNTDWLSASAPQQYHMAAYRTYTYSLLSSSSTNEMFSSGQHCQRTVTSTTHKGFYCGSITSNSMRRFISADNTFNSNTAVVSTQNLPNHTIGLMANNQISVVTQYSSFGYSFFSAGLGLTIVEQQVLSQIVEKYQYALGRNVGTAKSFYYNKNYTNESNAFIYKAGITDSTQMSAVNTLVNSMKVAGIWSKMKAVYPLVGGTATAHQFNLVIPAKYYTTGDNEMFTLAFSGTLTHDNKGILGVSGYATTYFTPNLDFVSYSEHVSVNTYSSFSQNTNGTTRANPHMGVTSWTGEKSLKLQSSSSTQASATIGNTLVKNVGAGGHKGFWALSRTSSLTNGCSYLYNDGNFGKFTDNYTLGTGPIILMGDKGVNSNMGYSFFSIGDGLTDAELTSMRGIVTTFNSTLSRE